MSVSSLSIRRKSLMWDLQLLGALLVQAEGQADEQLRAPEGAIMNGVKVGGQWIPEGSNFSILKPQDSDVGEALVNFTNMGTIDPEQFAETSLKVSSQISATLGLVNDGLTFQAPEMPPHPDNIKENVKEYQDAQNELTNAETPDDVGSKFGKFIKAAAPIATAIAFAVAPEIILPMIAGQSISWGFALGSAALGWAVNMATEKALDMAGVDNKWVRLGASAITGLMAGGALTGLRKNLARKTKVLKCESACELKKFQLRMSDLRAEEIDRAIRGFRHSTIVKGTPEVFDHAQKTAGKLNQILAEVDTTIAENKKRLFSSYRQLDLFHSSIGVNKNPVSIRQPGKFPKPKTKGAFQYTKETLEGSEKIVFSKGETEALESITKFDVGDKRFRGFNALLREGFSKDKAFQARLKDYDGAIEKLPFYRWNFLPYGLKEPQPLSRYIYLPPGTKPEFMKNLKVGETFSDNGFATFNKTVDGGNFFNDDHGHFFNQVVTGNPANKPTVKFIVKPSQATNARDLDLVNKQLGEKGMDIGGPTSNSVIFPRDTKFKITDVREMDVPQFNPMNKGSMEVEKKIEALADDIWDGSHLTPHPLSLAFYKVRNLVRTPAMPIGDELGQQIYDIPYLSTQGTIRETINKMGGVAAMRADRNLIKGWQGQTSYVKQAWGDIMNTSDLDSTISRITRQFGGDSAVNAAKQRLNTIYQEIAKIPKSDYVKAMERSDNLGSPRMSQSKMTIVTLEEVGR